MRKKKEKNFFEDDYPDFLADVKNMLNGDDMKKIAAMTMNPETGESYSPRYVREVVINKYIKQHIIIEAAIKYIEQRFLAFRVKALNYKQNSIKKDLEKAEAASNE